MFWINRASCVACLALFWASFVASLSDKIIDATPQVCLDDNLLLFFNRACSKNGTADLVQAIGPHVRDAHSRADGNRSRSSDDHLWSFNPVCTGSLAGIDSQLCVYTNASFAGGRGISIFTTPEIAEAFAALPPVHNPDVLKDINPAEGPWYTQRVPNKGQGLLAKSKLKRGDRVTATTPVLLAHMELAMAAQDVFPMHDRERILRLAVDQLPAATKESFLGLATLFNAPDLIVQDVMKTNAFEIQVGGVMHLAVYPEQSRINHDCAPNAQYYLDPLNLTHNVYATRDIAPDEEINVASDTVTRQDVLQYGFHFKCTCSRCTSSDSDTALREIDALQQILGDWEPTSTADTAKGRRLIRMYKDQGLDGFLDVPYGLEALAYSAYGDADHTEKYALLAAEAAMLKEGPHSPSVKAWEKVAEEPQEHWSWMWRINQRKAH